MPDIHISEFIKLSREKGASDSDIKAILLKNGWAEDEVNKAINSINITNIPIPPPPAQHFGMWIGFLYVLLFISLYVSATSLGGIFHYFVDEMITDNLDKLDYGKSIAQYMMQTYIASLIVGYPIFSFLFFLLKNQVNKNVAIKSLKVRKSLIYFTLVGTFIITIGHLIATVYNFLGGSISARSLAHFAVTLVVAGTIFVYFLLDVWSDRKQQ